MGWKLKVRPTGTDSLTITLPATTNCSARGAICTEDGRRLSNSPSATVAWPAAVVETTPTVSLAGGSGTEGDDSSIVFTVTLDEAASETVTVDYATADGSAEAGDDYTAASGTLSFAAGETSKAISVAIDDDIDNESDETFTVTVSNASGADLGTKTATGTIRNRTVVVETTPTVSIAGGSGTEGDDDDIDFTVTLDEAASGTVTVDYATSDGSAAAGDDYTAKSGTLSFSAGENQQDDLSRDRGRHRERERRDVHRHGLEPLGRRPRYQLGHGDDQEPLRGPADGPLREHAVRARRQRVHLRAPLQREPRGALPTLARPLVHARPGGRHQGQAPEPAGHQQEPELDDHRRAPRHGADQHHAARRGQLHRRQVDLQPTTAGS